MSTSGLEVKDRSAKLILRCECGASITASRKSRLVELARIHFGEFHPDLGAGVPADLILAMAEEKEAAANDPELNRPIREKNGETSKF
jgi:hypothetical protein